MKDPLLNHLFKLKRIKGPIQKKPVVHQQIMVPLMNIDHLVLLVGVCFEENIFQQIQRHTCSTNGFHSVDEPFMPYSIKGFRYINNIHLTSLGG